MQRASVAAWNDEEHVERTRERTRRKRELFLPVLERKGWRVTASAATMYLWVDVPGGETLGGVAERLLEHGVVVAPGRLPRRRRRGLRPRLALGARALDRAC